MNDAPNGFNFFDSLVGPSRSANLSSDGKSINVTGEIADGVKATFAIRPSSQPGGFAIDFAVDGGQLRHIEGDPIK